ncbi:MAG: DNA-binding protein [Vicinamibacterales bacterium]
MMRVVPILLALVVGAAWAVEVIGPEAAREHLGEEVQVCGMVASAKYATRSRGQPTFLNLGRPYPVHIFTALIWGRDRSAFPYPPESLAGQPICVRGVIVVYRGKPEIIVTDPTQISGAGGR